MSSSVENVETHILELQDIKLVDSLCDRFEDAWLSGKPPDIEAYLDGVQNPLRDVLFRELLVLELQLLKDAASSPQIADYLNRFPKKHRLVTGCFEEVFTEPDDQLPKPRESRFRVVRLLGRGGLGRIWQADDIDLNREVALKDVCSALANHPESRQRFLKEAEITGRLEHPGIVPIYALGQFEDGQPYYAMRMIHGKTLRDAIREFHELQATHLDTSCLAWRKLLARFVDVCNTIHYAHSRNVVHCDIKPDNIMLGEFGETLVVDWGLAKDLSEDSDTLSEEILPNDDAPRSVAGTLQYMSPEQALGKTALVSPRSDVYSLGATLFCIMTNRPPVLSSRTVEALHSIAEGDFPRPRQITSQIPRPLEAICLKALATNPSERYPKAKDLGDDVERWLASEPISAMQESAVEKIGRWRRRHRTLVRSLFISMSLLILSGLAAALIWLSTPGTLIINVTPRGATVGIAGESYVVGEQGLEVRLAHGVYQLRVSAPNRYVETQTIMVRRGQSKDVSISLDVHRGFLNADCEPPGTELEIAGISYGSRIRSLSLPVGDYTGIAWKNGCFDSKPYPFTISHKKSESIRASLDSGVIWEYRDSGVQHEVWNIGDVDDDGVDDFLHNEVSHVVVFSGRDGSHNSVPIESPYSLCILQEVGAGPILVLAKERELQVSGQVERVEHAIVQVDAYRLDECLKQQSTSVEPIWGRDIPCPNLSDATYASVIATADLNHDKHPDLAVATRDGRVITLNGSNGDTFFEHQVFDHKNRHLTVLESSSADSTPYVNVVFANAEGEASSEKRDDVSCTMGRLNLVTGEFDWHRREPAASYTCGADIDGDSINDFCMRTQKGIRITSGLDGSRISEYELDNDEFHYARSADGSPAYLVLSEESITRVNSDSNWSFPGSMSNDQFGVKRGRLAQVGHNILVCHKESLRAINIETGTEVWKLNGTVHGLLNADWDGDGIDEVFVGRSNGLSCLDRDGRLKWHLRLASTGRPHAVVPDSDGDGYPEILLVSHSGLIAKVRGPRILWQMRANKPLLAQPQTVDLNSDGIPEIIQLGDWGNKSSVGCLDGSSGRLIWTSDIRIPNNRAQAISDVDLDGQLELVAHGAPPDKGETHLFLIDLATGRTKISTKIGVNSIYATPVVADLNQDGFLDIATMRYDRSDIVAIDGNSWEWLWNVPTDAENQGALTAADIDQDGRLDVIAPGGDGVLYAIDGRSGKIKWETPLGKSLRGKAVVEDVDGDGTLEALVLGNKLEGDDEQRSKVHLFVLNAINGKLIWSFTSDDNQNPITSWRTEANPVVVGQTKRSSQRPTSEDERNNLIVAPLGTGGIAAVDFRQRESVWTRQFGSDLISTPAVTDVDGDSKLEIVFTGLDGRLFVLDLLTGESLIELQVSQGKISAPPTVADLNSDGIKDVLIADQNSFVTAVDGRTIQSARRRAQNQ